MARAVAACRRASALRLVIVAAILALAAPALAARVENTDPSVAFSAGWAQDTSRAWSGGSAHTSASAGSLATLTFRGTAVNWIGGRSAATGIARVYVDGVLRASVDTFSPHSEETRVAMYTVNDLADATHTLTIEVTGQKNAAATDALIVVDAFDVPAVSVSRLQEMDQSVAYTAGWTMADATRNWSEGQAARSAVTGALATFSFTGTRVSWIGARMPSTGVAAVYLDGAHVADVDTYAASEQIQAELFASAPLANGAHTLAIQVTGQKNAASSASTIVLDAFEVTIPGRRYQDTDPAIVYTPAQNWFKDTRDHAYSEGTVVEAFAAATATFAFNGTGVSFVSAMCSRCGIIDVSLDGGPAVEVDLYEPTDAPQKTVFSAQGLAAGAHVLTVQATGRKNPLSQYYWVVVDAFDVTPDAPPAACSYALSPSDLSNVAAAGGVVSITVAASGGCPVTATSFQPWVSVAGITPSGAATTVQLQISANAGAARATSIVVAGRLFLVTQTGP